jgi:hypothetical protein
MPIYPDFASYFSLTFLLTVRGAGSVNLACFLEEVQDCSTSELPDLD